MDCSGKMKSLIDTTTGVKIPQVQTSRLHPKENGVNETENQVYQTHSVAIDSPVLGRPQRSKRILCLTGIGTEPVAEKS